MGETLRAKKGAQVSARRAILAAITVVAMAASGCSSGTTAVSRSLDPGIAAKLDSAITSAIAAAKVPGAMVGIWSPEGDYVKAFGEADTTTGAPMQTDFYSRIGSVTKTFTATALLQLADQGKLALDDPIARYVDGVPNGDEVTLRQLAGMRSGLPDYLENPDFEKALADNPIRHFTPQELLGWAFARPVVFPPGQKWQYSNTNYILLGLTVEKAAGSSLADFLTEHILGPLGLTHTSLPTETQFPEPHADGYTEPAQAGGPPVVATDWTASYTWAAGAMISTLDDLRVWVPALANGELISPALAGQRLGSPPTPGLPPGVGYGIGVFNAAGWIGHNGSLPGYQTVAVYLPQRRMTVVAMINSDIKPPGGPQASTAVVKAITSVLTPDHIYDV